MRPLTDYQKGQLLHLHLTGDWKYKTNAGTRVGRKQWVQMLDALQAYDYVEYTPGLRITPAGRAFLYEHHLSIPLLN